MTRPGRQAPALDQRTLEELGLRYVGRFATTRAKLVSYLKRKIRERGWEGIGEPDLQGMAERLARCGYIDDAAYADAKARALSSRGYGPRRVDQVLRAAGIDDGDAIAARGSAEAAAAGAAIRFARRRRLGPYAQASADPRERRRSIAAMLRAGHSLGIARAILDAPPGFELSPDDLAELVDRS